MFLLRRGQMKGVAVNQLGQLHSFSPIEETVVTIFGVAISKVVNMAGLKS